MTTKPPPPIAIYRTPKKAPLEVIEYETKMLRDCYAALASGKLNDFEVNVYLESYLVHFRNLCEFLGRPFKGKFPSPSDMTIRRPADWTSRTLTSDEIESITKLAEPLYNQYWGDVSQQLQHCTHPRFERKVGWPIAEMHAALGDALRAFEALKVG